MRALLHLRVFCFQVTDFFSYEHFYVIYCKFWELDSDHDLEINKQDLSRHADQGKIDTTLWSDTLHPIYSLGPQVML